jgi:hypothetical protein
MAERPSRIDRLPDVWMVASSVDFLRLLKLFEVSHRVIGARLAVPKTNVSMWLHGRQEVPRRHVAALRAWAEQLLAEHRRVMDKALAEAPTPAAEGRVLRDYADPIVAWAHQVHLAAGTFETKIRGYVAQLEALVAQATLSPQDEEDIEIIAGHVSRLVAVRRAAREAATQEQDDDAQDE